MPRTTAKRVILDILRVGDGEWSGKVKLHKAFYFAHLYYANEHPGFLTDWPIAKLQHGPGIYEDEPLIWGMADEGLLEVELVHEGPYPEYRYRLSTKGRQESSEVPEDAHLAIEKAALFSKDRTASELSFLTHERSRSWNEAQMGDILNIYIDTIPDKEYHRRQHQLSESRSKLAAFFGGAPDET
ncbi:MAG: hypothetical protein K2R98_26230 [Gemmataceae bacterium]|nr:hypothetical protein [Gemmataceae bacterium]